MKFFIFLFLINFQVTESLAKGGSPPQPDLCESSTFCVNGKMPLYNQADYKWLEYLSQKTGQNYTKDLGYCAPTAVAMFFAGLKLQAPKAKFNNYVDQVTDQNVNIADKGKEIIFEAGQNMGTRWNDGGTHFLRVLGHNMYVNHRLGNYTRKTSEDAWSHLIAGSTSQNFKGDIKKHKMNYLILLGIYKGGGHKLNSVDCSKSPCEINYKMGVAYWREGSHVLVINGYEGDYFKIYDPWGRIYNVRIDRKFIFFGHRGFIWHMNGAYGFIKTYGMDLNKTTQAVMIDGYYGIGLKD